MEPDDKTAAGAARDPLVPSPWDSRLFIALRTKGHPRLLETLLKWYSRAGNYGLFWVGLAAAAWIAGAGSGRGMFIVTLMFVYPTLLVNFIVKLIVGRQRPVSDDPRLAPLVRVPSSPSFPSSHAAMSFAAAAAMTFYYSALAPVFYLLAFVMSWTRVYLGIHYPSDVIAGMATGFACSLIWWLLLAGWVLG